MRVCVRVCRCVSGWGFLDLECTDTMKTWAWVPFLQILVPALSVCFIFTVTIGVFPAVTAEVKSSIAGTSAWGEDTRGSQDGVGQGLGSGERDPGTLLVHLPFLGLKACSPLDSWGN